MGSRRRTSRYCARGDRWWPTRTLVQCGDSEYARLTFGHLPGRGTLWLSAMPDRTLLIRRRARTWTLHADTSDHAGSGGSGGGGGSGSGDADGGGGGEAEMGRVRRLSCDAMGLVVGDATFVLRRDGGTGELRVHCAAREQCIATGWCGRSRKVCDLVFMGDVPRLLPAACVWAVSVMDRAPLVQCIAPADSCNVGALAGTFWRRNHHRLPATAAATDSCYRYYCLVLRLLLTRKACMDVLMFWCFGVLRGWRMTDYRGQTMAQG